MITKKQKNKIKKYIKKLTGEEVKEETINDLGVLYGVIKEEKEFKPDPDQLKMF